MNKHRWAIIGVGQVAYQVAAALRSHPQVILSAVYSRSPDKAANFAQDFAIDHPIVDLEQLWADHSVDIVYIATPNHTHKDLCLKAIQAKKHVLCEKPLGVTGDEIKEIINAQAQSSCLVMEALWTRFLPLFPKIKKLLTDEAIGRVFAYEASLGHYIPFDEKSRFYNRQMGGGAILDLGVYPLSLAQWIFGDIDHITPTVNTVATMVEDDALLVTKHKSGVQGEIKVSFRRVMENGMVIYGESGRIEIAGPLYRPCCFSLIHNRSGAPSLIPGTPMSMRERLRFHQGLFTIYERIMRLKKSLGWSKRQEVAYHGNGYGHQIEAFLAALQQGETMVETMPLADSLKVLQAIDTCR